MVNKMKNNLLSDVFNGIGGASFSLLLISSVIFMQTYSAVAILSFQLGTIGIFAWSSLRDFYLK
jgi:hypothetical protein